MEKTKNIGGIKDHFCFSNMYKRLKHTFKDGKNTRKKIPPPPSKKGTCITRNAYCPKRCRKFNLIGVWGLGWQLPVSEKEKSCVLAAVDSKFGICQGKTKRKIQGTNLYVRRISLSNMTEVLSV